MSSDVLEKRYRTLLRAYPAEYRRERADELIDTLLGDEPTTRRWPTLTLRATPSGDTGPGSRLRPSAALDGSSNAPLASIGPVWRSAYHRQSP